MKKGVSKEIAVLRAISEVVVRERNVRRLLDDVIGVLDREMGMLRGTIALLEGDELKIEAAHQQEMLGHTGREVVAGVALGIATAFCVCRTWDFWK